MHVEGEAPADLDADAEHPAPGETAAGVVLGFEQELQIWSDNETEQDLLGFRVHADLIRSVVTDKRVLPIVLGVFAQYFLAFDGAALLLLEMARRSHFTPL